MKGELINFWAYANPTSSRRNHGNEGVGTVGQIQFQLAGRQAGVKWGEWRPGKRIAVEFCYLTGRAWHTWFAFMFCSPIGNNIFCTTTIREWSLIGGGWV